MAMHGGEINVDPNRLAIVGNSVGGNMTAVIALMAKAKGGPAIKCQVMFWPGYRRELRDRVVQPVRRRLLPYQADDEMVRVYNGLLLSRVESYADFVMARC